MTQDDFKRYVTSRTDAQMGLVFKAACREVADKISKYDKRYRSSAGWKLDKDGWTVRTKSVVGNEDDICFPCSLIWASDDEIKSFAQTNETGDCLIAVQEDV